MVSLLVTVTLLCCVSSNLGDYSNDSNSTTDPNDAHPSTEENADVSRLSGNSEELEERSLGGAVGTIVTVGKGIVKETMKQGIAAGAELLSSKHDHADGKVNVKAKTLAGAIAGKATGGVIGYIPIVPNRIQGGISHVAQVVGDQAMISIADLVGKATLKDVMEFASKGLKSLGLPPLIPTSGKRSEDGKEPPRRGNVVSGMSNEPVPLETMERRKDIPGQRPHFVPPPPLIFQYKPSSESMFNPTIVSPGRNGLPNNLNPSNSGSPIYNVFQLPQQIGTFNMYNSIAQRSGGDNPKVMDDSTTTAAESSTITTTLTQETGYELDQETIN